MNPRFIILDEPTSSLDPAAKKSVLTLLQNLRKQGIGIVHITHSMDEARGYRQGHRTYLRELSLSRTDFCTLGGIIAVVTAILVLQL